MGQLEHPRTGARRFLRDEHLVGRRETADLRLEDPVTSGLHATLRWEGHGWVARDLGSRNGVFVDGTRIGQPTRLVAGARLGFGSPEDPWRLVDAGPPRPFAESLAGGGEVQGTAGTLGLPDAAAELVSVTRTSAGWVAERGADLIAVADGAILDAGGPWRLHLPEAARAETTEAAGAGAYLTDTDVVLRVSQDLEHIEVEVGSARLDHYAANELLYVLALARQADAAVQDPSERGWVHFDDLARRLSLSPDDPKSDNRLRQWIHQCRRRFERVGVLDGERVVERRAGSRQVRLGAPRVRIEGAA